MSTTCLSVERRSHDGTELATLLVTLNRPKQLNALNDTLMDELGAALGAGAGDPTVGCMVITGSDKAFAAGADIGGMAGYSYMDAFLGNYITRHWEQLRAVRKPVIAAVAGFALGGGCELALACDFIYASKAAKFGQPEVKLGVIPGFGGTQLLARRAGIGKARELVYTGDTINAEEALRIGLVDRVVERYR